MFVGTLVVVPDAFSMFKPGEKFQMSSGHEGERLRGQNAMAEGVSGLKSMGVRDINYKMVFIANNVLHTESRFGTTVNIRDDNEKEIIENMTAAERDEIRDIIESANLYRRLAQSICPMIYGNEDIKKGILLMLFGGIHKVTHEGMKIRGDINICIVGDPSTAKSQFLKFVHGFLPRCVYTSGKASSAAGLTASVQRDPETGEFTIEAGALMLADNGICCCDEFDKMDEKDQVAIHEAMEQQTISITKAGIQATLNARASILAAANPIMGRYDKNKTLRNNLNLSPPLMSRFDLFYVVCDECDENTDSAIARHILHTHQYIAREVSVPFPTHVLQRNLRSIRIHPIRPDGQADPHAPSSQGFARLLRHAAEQPQRPRPELLLPHHRPTARVAHQALRSDGSGRVFRRHHCGARDRSGAAAGQLDPQGPQVRSGPQRVRP